MQYQKEDVRNRIVDAAKTEFLRVGYFRASMLQISNRAHVPIGNLYRYFASKASLYDAIVGTAKERIIECIENGKGISIEADNLGGNSTKIIVNKASDGFLDLSKNYHKEIILLTQKSGGSAYDGFINEVIGRIRELLKDRLGNLCNDSNEFLFDIVADNVTRGAFRILTECPIEQQHDEIVKLLVFYFNHLEDRLY
ncbi:MAG: TetR/AcrR family transcriptional regulator [Clostridia bacterium]|nr:TetR/AcrR family transcriptional regulator [Clostridia bacterium]